MSLLHTKLRRDLWALKTQAIAVALVMACGICMMINTRSLILSLETARDEAYQRYHFADLFAQLKRAPLSLAQDLRSLPGLAALEPSLTVRATVDLPGVAEPISAHIHSVPDHGEPTLNRLHLRAGKLLSSASHQEILISESFALAHKLKPGDTLAALIYGKKQPLRIVGIVISPEYIFESPPGASLPDPRTFGIFWMRYEELSEAADLYRAFNTLSVTLAPGASPQALQNELDRRLRPFGGSRVYGRDSHPSHVRLRDELGVLRALAIGFPLVFLSVSAFMANTVLTRQINLQRDQIAILKAFGFTNGQIGLHYTQLTLVIILGGTVLGVVAGIALSYQFVELYQLFFRFPRLDYHFSWPAFAFSFLASGGATLLGTLTALRSAFRLAPAEAMRPTPPASFRPAFAERLPALRNKISTPLRIALRNLERRPFKALFTALALALSTGILIIPTALKDSINFILDFQWDITVRYDVTLSLSEPGPARALSDFAHLPGVIHAAPARMASVEISSGAVSRRLGLLGLPPDCKFHQILGPDYRPIPLPAHGLTLSRKLAEVLGVRLGDNVTLHFLEGNQTVHILPVTALAEDFSGLIAYTQIETINRLLREGNIITSAHLTLAQPQLAAFYQAVKNTPRAAAIIIKNALRDSFRNTTAQFIGMLQTMYSTLSIIVCFGIAYNSARISLSERYHELATLRVLGFTQREVATVLISELLIITFVALPLGLLLGSGLAHGLFSTIQNESIRLPLILTPYNFTFATLVVLAATAFSLYFATRKLHQLDMVAALKARD